MRAVRLGLYLVFGLALAACGRSERAALDPISPAPAQLQSFTSFADGLAEASCPLDTPYIAPQPIRVTPNPITVSPQADGAEIRGLRLAGAWHLTSDEENFGGLSGLAIQPSGHLLTVSDGGAFISIGMEAGAPDGSGTLAYMRSSTDALLSGKSAGDAEGLELTENGLALVSFERDHRVLAFDLEGCGSAARGINVAGISDRPDGLGRKIPENDGLEGLMLDAAGFLVGGLEVPLGSEAVIGQIDAEHALFSTRLSRPEDTKLVGLDGFETGFFALYRGYSPLSGNTIVIDRYSEPGGALNRLAILKRPYPVDNFEGITASRLADGTVRLYIISDDNFSDRQRTLLMAFDVTAPDTLQP